ncbi:hypothetical protein [Clostridium sp. UBA6640]|uniref:hypothetical protein n=1 Tax=Clostridium sp. UBA6640 TaxID=1946370 RepID=UPI0025BEEAE5|nr:hypothetical protein [Clostridium sp. UBA6640]
MSEINLIISNFIFRIIEENVPYIWISEEEPFINQYNGKISYDYSGKVEKMVANDLKEIVKNSPASMFYSSELESLLSEVHINQWIATHQSNFGKHWLNYKDLIEEKFNEWKYTNFNLYDEDGEELNEELDIELDDVFYKFLEKTPIDIYYAKILSRI